MLELLKKQVNEKGEELIVLGREHNKQIGWEAHGNLGLKLKLVNDFVNETNHDLEDVVLFMDAYDVIYKGNARTILERYSTFGSPIVFGAESVCFPGGLESNYPEYTKQYPFRYLNSGLFIGKIWAIRECFREYIFEDKINDQHWWKLKFLERQDLIQLDYTNKIFLNCLNVNKNSIQIIDDKIEYNEKTPQILHFNGPSKAILNRYAKLEPNPYFIKFPNVSRELIDCVKYYISNGGD
jgi:hypothetical protein